jgi:hypothetical protein
LQKFTNGRREVIAQHCQGEITLCFQAHNMSGIEKNSMLLESEDL